MCFDRGWKYEGDWKAMSKGERALWLAFVSVESWRVEQEQKRREQQRAVLRGG